MNQRQHILAAFLFLTGLLPCFAQENPTFSEHIAPIIYSKCTSCHRAGEIAPFPLVTYADVAQRSLTIAYVTQMRTMPPWKPVHGYGEFLGDRSLTDDQIALIDRWVKNGAQEGDASKTPPPPTFPAGSQLGVPDLILQMGEQWNIEDNFKDVYRFFVIPTNALETRPVAALEFRPGNPKVVHHVLYFQDTSGTARIKDAADPQAGYSGFGDPGFESVSSFLGWVPGAQQRFYPPTIGATMYKGSDLVLQIHYAPSDTKETDRSSVNVFFQKNTAVREIQQTQLTPANLPKGQLFTIPANTKKTFSTQFTIPLNVSILGVAPHMHLLGRTAHAYAVTPTKDTIELVKVDDWDFHWQGGYAFKNLVRVPKGSVLHYDAEYDNTVDNPENPSDPPKLVRWGESTTDEMLLCYFFWLPYQPGDETMAMETTTSVANDNVAAVPAVLSPNPAHGGTQLTFVVGMPTQVTIDVVDAMGSVIADVATNALFESGQHILPINAHAFARGAYFVRLRMNGSITSVPLMIN